MDAWCWSSMDAVLGAEVVDWIVVGFSDLFLQLTIQSTVFPKEAAESASQRLASQEWQSCIFNLKITHATVSKRNCLNVSFLLFIFFPLSHFPTGLDSCWTLPGWGSRLYSLVGGTPPFIGDNYTVYCLPWGARYSLVELCQNLSARSAQQTFY